LLSLLLCGARAHLRPSRVPTCHKTGIGRFGLLDPVSFLVALAFEIVGVRGSFLSAGRLVTGFELEITLLPGVQRRTCPEVVLVFCQKMPDQDGELACRRDGGAVLPAPALPAQKETAQRARAARRDPARLDQHAARVPAAVLGDPPVICWPRSGLPHAWV